MNGQTTGNANVGAVHQPVSGKFLSFFLAGEEYGVAILKVREIIGLNSVTPLPRTPEFVLGVINLRGKIIPVVDLRIRFGMPVPELGDDDEHCIVVVDMEVDGVDHTTGCVVDSVSEVLNVDEGQVEPAPKCARIDDTDFILGLAKQGEQVLILLDIDRILTDLEMGELERLRRAGPEGGAS